MEKIMAMRLADDPDVQTARAAVQEKARALADAEATRRRLEQEAGLNTITTTFDFEVLAARTEEQRAKAAYDRAVRATATPEQAARQRIVAATRRARAELVSRLLVAAEAAHAAAVELRAWDVGLARDLELADGQAEQHPLPALLDGGGATEQIKKLAWMLAGDRHEPAPELRPGMTRVHVLTEFVNVARVGAREFVGPTWLDDEIASEAIKKGLARAL